jgi:hypothetical protein
VNELRTFWGYKEFELRFGLAWMNRTEEPVRLCAKQLDHEEFNYVIDYVRLQRL